MVAELAAMVLAWFAAQNGSPWWECGKRYTPIEAEARATEYAQAVVVATKDNPAPDVQRVLLAMIAQESAFDECNIAGWKKKEEGLKKPTRKQAVAVLEKATNARKVDAGPLQRVYPPYGAKKYSPEAALDLFFQVGLAAKKMPQYYKMCVGNYGARKAWKVKWRGKRTCEDLYFTSWNTGGAINPKYYLSVSYQWKLWERELKKRVKVALTN